MTKQEIDKLINLAVDALPDANRANAAQSYALVAIAAILAETLENDDPAWKWEDVANSSRWWWGIDYGDPEGDQTATVRYIRRPHKVKKVNRNG